MRLTFGQEHKYFYSCKKKFRFLALKMPVAIGYGERDTITPPHQVRIRQAIIPDTHNHYSSPHSLHGHQITT